MENIREKTETVDLRPAEEVMRLDRMGSFHQTRLSFMRQLLRRMFREKWKFKVNKWDINDCGFGTAVYSVEGMGRSYSLIAFVHDLPPNMRSDRVIATSWDLTFTLFDGLPNLDDINRLRKSVPIQEEGRFSKKELVLGRANKSTRLWNSVVTSLSKGLQPSKEVIESVGYLMRTTAVYGSGKFGLCDRVYLKNRPELAAPFQAEMLAVYLVRSLVMDLIEHVAKKIGQSNFTKLLPELKRGFGIGNSTGLGMAPFLVNHPSLLDRWVVARETAIARVRSVQDVTSSEIKVFAELLESQKHNVKRFSSTHPVQVQKNTNLLKDLEVINEYLKVNSSYKYNFWDKLFRWGQENLTLEGQEALLSLMLEPYGKIIDHLSDEMAIDNEKSFTFDGAMPCLALKKIIEDSFPWALKYDYERVEEQSRFWYVSEEKLEPRLGERFEEDGADLEQPLAVGRDLKALHVKLSELDNKVILADFLLKEPQFRHSCSRILKFHKFLYGEIQDNLINKKMMPIDLLRCKLSFFGATRFDPRSDRWVRICMYQNAPFPEELDLKYDDFWPYKNFAEI